MKGRDTSASEQHYIKKLESVFYEWKSLQKHKNRTTEAHQLKEQQFVSQPDELFDTAHADAQSYHHPGRQGILVATENTDVQDLLVH